MQITNPETLNALRERGCLINDKVNASAVAKLLAEQLEDGHIAESLDQVAAVETTFGQIAAALIGGEDPDFIEWMKPLLSGGAHGKVQLALSNGFMLCAGRTQIEINIEGEIVRRSISTRFLSGDHAVVGRYVLDPQIKKAESAATSKLALGQLVAQRQPDMAPQVGSYIERLNVTWQRALGTGA